MAKVNEHGRIISVAAKAALEPLGLKRKGQSRLWYSDQRFWVISVEFEPSGWSKGSYLKTGVKWLWNYGPGLDMADRPMDFVPFESAEQFTPLIEAMAACAAHEVEILRDRFRSFANIYQYLVAHATRDAWPIHNAAIVTALAGDFEGSRRYFQRMQDWPTFGYDWQLELKARSAALAALLDHPKAFRSEVLAIIERNRALRKFSPDPSCLETVEIRTGQ